MSTSAFPEAERLLHFWFGDLHDGFADDEHRSSWFSGGSEFDATCRVVFLSLAVRAAGGELDAWLGTARSRLAYIIICDQIPRNIYRGEPRAFATDGAALNAARTGVEERLDRELSFDGRCFFYLPFEHSENLVDQHTAVGLFSELRDQTPQGFRHLTGSYLNFAHQHRDIMEKFGRFPHRNGVLGRRSTAAETAYLEEGHGFGQTTA